LPTVPTTIPAIAATSIPIAIIVAGPISIVVAVIVAIVIAVPETVVIPIVEAVVKPIIPGIVPWMVIGISRAVEWIKAWIPDTGSLKEAEKPGMRYDHWPGRIHRSIIIAHRSPIRRVDHVIDIAGVKWIKIVPMTPGGRVESPDTPGKHKVVIAIIIGIIPMIGGFDSGYTVGPGGLISGVAGPQSCWGGKQKDRCEKNRNY
jgi:hypothetical protein